MASFQLHDYESGEEIFSFITNFKEYEFIHVLTYDYNQPGEPVKTLEGAGTFHYKDVVLLRDFLSSAIDLYDKKKKEERKRKSVVVEKAE